MIFRSFVQFVTAFVTAEICNLTCTGWYSISIMSINDFSGGCDAPRRGTSSAFRLYRSYGCVSAKLLAIFASLYAYRWGQYAFAIKTKISKLSKLYHKEGLYNVTRINVQSRECY